MSARDWVVLGAGFLISALTVITLGVALAYRRLGSFAAKRRDRVAAAFIAMQGAFSLLLVVGVFALNAPRGTWQAVLISAPVAALGLFGYWNRSERRLEVQMHERRSI